MLQVTLQGGSSNLDTIQITTNAAFVGALVMHCFAGKVTTPNLRRAISNIDSCSYCVFLGVFPTYSI